MQNKNSKLKIKSAKPKHQSFKLFTFCFEFNEGFTLLEMVIAMGIFSVVMISAIGIMLGVSNSEIKANGIQSILDNVRFSLELITKEMRTGSNYVLSTNCAPSGSEITFTTSLENPRTYFLDSTTSHIMRAIVPITSSDCNGISGKVQPFTADDVLIQALDITTHGTAIGPTDGQPWITMHLKVKSKDVKYQLTSSMDLQTTIVQRFRDIQQ